MTRQQIEQAAQDLGLEPKVEVLPGWNRGEDGYRLTGVFLDDARAIAERIGGRVYGDSGFCVLAS